MPAPHPSPKSLSIISRVLFLPDQPEALARVTAELTAELTSLSREEFDDLANMANLNHVIIRGFETVLKFLRDAGIPYGPPGQRKLWPLSKSASPLRFPACTTSLEHSQKQASTSR